MEKREEARTFRGTALAAVSLAVACSACVSGAERRLSAPERTVGPPVAAASPGALGLLHPAPPAATSQAAEPGTRRGGAVYVAGRWEWDGVRWVWFDGEWETLNPRRP